ncbi:type II toxin-antitoxin system VapC family toxin [Microtetraspora sp. NBRC 16547]|uniref:type II toxin-antitoxin system VapC family toxin n=1 Tax=Microtetraspora sp. NBRC 16547 TaxID=3030993 RepID=UPI0024A365F2|nr:type II toxin-antitoxin system VapC family toxin [Microtetraspora sp. NBRC 16547]GLX02620.1 hypothetical protein Misp02_67060 [Microtetraspora sp. NBRC 16547]
MSSLSDRPRFVLDTGALIQLELGNEDVLEILARAAEGTAQVVIPRTVVAEVWRGGPRQAWLGAFLKLAGGGRDAGVTFDELTPHRAAEIGRKIGSCGHDDIIAVNVALCARRSETAPIDAIVVTTDRSGVLRVDPELKSAILDI